MWKRGFLVLLVCMFFGFFSPPAYSSDVEPNRLSLQQMRLSSQLREALNNSRQSMLDLENYYNSMIAGLEMRLAEQSGELKMLSMHLTDTMSSFRSLSIELNNSSMALAVERGRRQALEKILAIGSLLFVAMVAGKITVFVLSKRGVRIPKLIKIIV